MFKQKYYFYRLGKNKLRWKTILAKIWAREKKSDQKLLRKEDLRRWLTNAMRKRAVAATRDIFSSSSLKRRSFAKMNNFRTGIQDLGKENNHHCSDFESNTKTVKYVNIEALKSWSLWKGGCCSKIILVWNFRMHDQMVVLENKYVVKWIGTIDKW